MTTARLIIGDALTFHLNRLSPGETLDADLAAVALSALNNIADSWNGQKSFLFREILSASSSISAASADLGTAWTGLASGDDIVTATVTQGGIETPLYRLTMTQYAHLQDKTTTGTPSAYAHDGAATVYLYPVPTGHVVTLLTKQAVWNFDTLDAEYVMPKGYRSALAAVLAESLAPALLGELPRLVASAARAARNRIAVQCVNPAILSCGGPRLSILNG